jgi:NAD(P)-dependent dehydrogenase (short-subunit alcohol dehydrogenase family)
MRHQDSHFADLDGKVVVITGASAGVGRAAAWSR